MSDNITLPRTVVEQALEALENWRKGPHDSVTRRGNTTRSDVAIALLHAALAQQVEPAQAQAGCETEADCDSQPWCRISGKCHRKQKQPEPVQEPFGYLWPTGRHPEFRFTQQKRDGVDGTPIYTAPQPQPDRGWAYKDECSEIAAELRRLHDEVESLRQAYNIVTDDCRNLTEKVIPNIRAQRDALLEALRELLADAEFLGWDTAEARAAIKAVEEGK